MLNVISNNPCIEGGKLIEKTKYSIMIFEDYKNRLFVRKSVLMSGIKVPLREESARNMIHAKQIEFELINEINGFRLN